ncbi:helix-turn-helix domain-containing protein [Flavobacterium sp.]|uniref:helix-turn-helix domain-containing protein n=1 Tax=Flavobacterium sp. TaxID=239 RepID=UPI00262811E0|nr:helix-turn-helix domain-containing protein [Flavobacterium sp.]
MSKKIKQLQEEVASLKALLHYAIQKSEEEQWLDSADVKTLFHFSESKLYRLRKANLIPCTLVGGRYMYPKSYFSDVLMGKIKEK